MEIARVVIVSSHLPILLAAIYSFIHFRRFNVGLQIFSYFIFFTFLIQFSSLVLWFFSINNMPLLHFYVIGEFLFLSWFYQNILGEYINVRIIWIIVILFSLFSICNSIFFQNIFKFNSNSITVQSILVIILSSFSYIVFLNKIVKQRNNKDIPSLNWINSGLFIYHLSNLLIFYFGATIMDKLSVTLGLNAWILHSLFSIVMYTCFLIGLYKAEKS